MKITKRQLRRIIKEEKTRVLRESGMPGIEGPVRDLWGSKEDEGGLAGSYEPLKTAAEWVEHLGQLIDQDMTERNVDLRDEGSEVVKALEMLRREYTDEMRGPTR